MLAITQQLVPTDTPALIEQLIGTWTPYAAFIAPLVLGVLVKSETRAKIKAALPVLTAAILAVVSVLAEEGMTWQTLIFRAPALWVIVEGSYRTLSGVATALAKDGAERSVNDLLLPRFGIKL